ncbi:MAG: hypothetical protein IJN43_11700 [Ruminococcus sp.]|nr:hypothetical protein [Ruminococcus sp.]
MKKNKSMRLAGGLMIATMLSTSIVSGTYAKYVTSDNADDSARVAKFGVTVTASGSLFDKTYMSVGGGNTPGGITADTDNTTLTVESSNDNKLVAPGTKNTEGITFAIAGTPEVDVKLDVVVDEVKEVFLNAKTDLPDMTTGKVDDKFDNTDDYYPVKFTLTQVNGDGTSTLVDGGKLSEVETKLEGLTNNSIDANLDLASEIGTLNLTWEWDFDAKGAGTYDKQDTLLGDLAAGTTLVPATTLIEDTDYCLNEAIKISISVTQLD